MNIVNTYIFKELVLPFFCSLFFLTFVFLMSRIPDITNMVMNYHISISSIFILLGLKLPRFLEFTIPMSVTISILLTFMRMAGENEIIALKSAGVSLYRLLLPVMAFSCLATILCLGITLFALPWANTSFKNKRIEFARSGVDMAIQERQFNGQVDNLMIYVTHVDVKTHDLKDVVIDDRRSPGAVSVSTAPAGKIISSRDKTAYTIRLYDGTINLVQLDNGSVNHINFQTYDIVIDLAAMDRTMAGTPKRIDERSLFDLVRFIRSGIADRTILSRALMELHEKFSIPAACLTLGLLSFPLGVQSGSMKRSRGLGLGIFFFFLYYFLLAAGWSLGEGGACPPFLGMWMPTIVPGIAGVYLLIRNTRDHLVRLSLPLGLQRFARRAGTRLNAFFSQRF